MKRKVFEIETSAGPSFKDITKKVEQEIKALEVKEGIAFLFLLGTTASLFINENEDGLLEDIKILFSNLVPASKGWKHDYLAFESNAHAHLRNILTNSFLIFPVENKKPVLGTWQRIFLAEWDTRPRTRKIYLSIIE